MTQTRLSFEDYDGFVEKFKPKKTTDDCYTPPVVYEAVLGLVEDTYGIDRATVVRPFYPGGDYEAVDYTGKAVVDNPPFSILAKIIAFYLERDVPFFLFAPSLTAFGSVKTFARCNHIVTDCNITYENGAVVKTSFVTNLGDQDIVAQTSPELQARVNYANDENLASKKAKPLPKYSFPDNIVTAALMMRYCRYGIKMEIRRGECLRVSKLDSMRDKGKAIFGGGLLLSTDKAAERAAAERAAAEHWEISERERALISQLDKASS